MRKIVRKIALDPETFTPVLKIMLNDNGNVIELFSGDAPIYKYTAEEREQIIAINRALVDCDMPEMTEEEADWSVGMHLKNIPEPTTEELERLAGYRVEKTIVYLDKAVTDEL